MVNRHHVTRSKYTFLIFLKIEALCTKLLPNCIIPYNSFDDKFPYRFWS